MPCLQPYRDTTRHPKPDHVDETKGHMSAAQEELSEDDREELVLTMAAKGWGAYTRRQSAQTYLDGCWVGIIVLEPQKHRSHIGMLRQAVLPGIQSFEGPLLSL